jgi:hypothetical protein
MTSSSAGPPGDQPFDELEWHDTPRYVRHLSMEDNVRRLARSMWGKAISEWAETLVPDVVAAVPAARGRPARGWVAGILCVTAVEAGMESSPELWDHVVLDIVQMTGRSRELVLRRWRDLQAIGLTAPTSPPSWWSRY